MNHELTTLFTSQCWKAPASKSPCPYTVTHSLELHESLTGYLNIKHFLFYRCSHLSGKIAESVRRGEAGRKREGVREKEGGKEGERVCAYLLVHLKNGCNGGCKLKSRAWSSIWVSQVSVRPKNLDHFPLFLQEHEQGARSEVKYLIWN